MKVCAESEASARLNDDSRSRSMRDWLVWVSTVDATAMPTLSMIDMSRIAVTRTFPRSADELLLHGQMTPGPFAQTVFVSEVVSKRRVPDDEVHLAEAGGRAART